MNTVINVHFKTTRLPGSDAAFKCQVVARQEFVDAGLHTITPAILIVKPLHNCVTLCEADIHFDRDNDQLIYAGIKAKVYKAPEDESSVFTVDRVDLLTEIAIKVFGRFLETDKNRLSTLDKQVKHNLVELLFTIPLTGLDEMISKDLTVTYG
jgi:hypothetical protein